MGAEGGGCEGRTRLPPVRLSRRPHPSILACDDVAYVLALRAEGVYHLVEQASAFGSAGALVIVVFGLFTRLGGPRTAAATLAAGLGVYLWGSFTATSYAFLLSLGAALGTYVLGIVVELASARRAEQTADA